MPSQETRHLKSIVAANIRRARDERDLTQAQLGRAIESDAACVSRWERARVMPTLGTLIVLSDVLDQEVSWFYVDHQERKAA